MHALSALLLLSSLLPSPLAAEAAPGQARDERPAGRGLVVVDARTGEPLAGVLARLDDGQSLRSAGDGALALPPGYAGGITLVLDGYEPLKLRPPLPQRIELRPLREQLGAGEEIVVTASRYGEVQAVAQSSLDHEEIAELHTTEDLPQLLEDTPGVFASTDSGTGMGYDYLTLRGFDQRRVGVMVNGIPLNDPEDHQVYWVDLPDLAASLEDVQVQRGVSNPVGGLVAVGGMVNLVTDLHRAEPGGELAFYRGSYRTEREMLSWHSGLRGGWFSTVMRLSHLHSDGYRERSGTEQLAWYLSLRALTPETTTTLNFYGGHEQSQQAWYGLSDAELAEDRRQNPQAWVNAVDDFRQPHLELHSEWRPGEKLRLRNALFWVHGEGFYDNFKEDRTAEDFGLDGALGLDPDAEVDLFRRKWVRKDQVGWVPQLELQHPRGRLVLGGNGWLFHSRHWGEVTYVEGFTPSELDSALTYYRYDGDKWSAAGYLDERLELLPGLHLLADLHAQRLHYEAIQKPVGNFQGELRNQWIADWSFLNPMGGLHWRPGQGPVGLWAHAGVAHREPADDDLFDTWTGPDDLGATPLFAHSEEVLRDGELAYVRWTDPLVRPERVMDYELGASWSGPELRVALDGYWMDFHDEIVPYGALDDDGYPVKGNAERTSHRGIEAELDARLGEAHQVHLAASKSWDRYEDFTIYEEQWDPDTWEYLGSEAVDLSGNPIAGFPDYLLTARWSSRLGPATLGLRLRAVGRQYVDNTGLLDHSIDPWQRLDLSLALDLGALSRGLEGATLDLRANNLLDAEYETWGYYDSWGDGRYRVPAAGRNFQGGLKMRF